MTDTSTQATDAPVIEPPVEGHVVELSLEESYADWPEKGSTQVQPWATGADVAPVVPRPGLPTLTTGARFDVVLDLGRALARLGYDNSVATGENPYGLVDPSIVAALQAFRRDYGVLDDPSGLRDPEREANTTFGPYTLEALLRAGERA